MNPNSPATQASVAPSSAAPSVATSHQHPARVVSGMRPTGALHLGHYHGVLKNWLALQQTHECFFFVADWHALTTQYDDPSQISAHSLEMVIDWLAAGVDPSKAVVFAQSQVPEHAELHLLLSMTTPLSWLERVPTYKDQQEKLTGKDLATYGFLGYPLLQSADILIYGAQQVPVGEDQVPHIELTREVARRFNHLYGQTGKTNAQGEPVVRPILVEPQALLTPAAKMPGLDGQKMSKSYGNTLGLRESADAVNDKIRKMPTDPARVRKTDPGNPDKCPVWALHQVYSSAETRSWAQAGCTQASIGCIQCKTPLIEAVVAEQDGFRARAQPFLEDTAAVQAMLVEGACQAREVAQATLQDVRSTLGLRLPR